MKSTSIHDIISIESEVRTLVININDQKVKDEIEACEAVLPIVSTEEDKKNIQDHIDELHSKLKGENHE